MPIPVLIPPGQLPVSDAETARAELLLAKLLQVLSAGTSGGTLVTPPIQIPDPPVNPTGVITPDFSSAEAQMFFRQQAVAMVKEFLSLSEVSITPGANKVPRADATGVLDPLWLSGSGGGGTSVGNTFNATCLATDVVGDLVRASASLLNVTRVDPTSILTLPAVGVIIQKPTSTTAVVQYRGLVQNIYTGLTPNDTYYVGTNGRPTNIAPTPGVGASVFIQIIGSAIDTDSLHFTPHLMLTELPG